MYGDRRASNTTAILLGACLVAGACLIGPCGGNRPPPPIPEKSVRQQVTAQLAEQLKDKQLVQGVGRALKRIQVTDVRFSRAGDRLLVEFELTWEPDAAARGTAVLVDDGFGRYQGEWNDGRIRLPLFVK